MNDRFLRACRLEAVDATPVWFMRQAGRYMAEYRAMREKYTLLEICDRPEAAAEVTLQPVRAFGVDAAILFADILLPLVPMGIKLEFAKGEGPVIHNPVATAADVQALSLIDARDALHNVMEALSIVKREIAGKTPLIGFAGAPFTLAAYLIEGGSSRSFTKAKRMMYEAPEVWHALMDKLATVVSGYLVAQADAGADVVQLFDSWVGALSPEDYAEYAQPYSKRILDAVKKRGIPSIHFGTESATLLPLMSAAGGDVLGLDWRTDLEGGWNSVGKGKGVQGNLDPVVLFAPRPEIERRVKAILAKAANRNGHIFNLGHGILQQTPEDNVRAVVEMVHELSAR